MDAIKNLDKVKDFIADHKEDFDRETLVKYGSSALLLLSGLATNKLVRTVAIGAVAIAVGKVAYDYLAKETDEEVEAA